MIPAKYWSPTKKLMVLGAMAGGKLVEDTATGNPLTFITDKAKPLKSLLIPFTPVQSGTGDPSPQNIRSILPWNGLKVWHGGKNLLEIALSNVDRGAYNLIYTEGKISVNSVGGGSSDYVMFKQKFTAGTYTMKGVPSGGVSSLRALSDKAITGWTFNAYYNAYYKDSVSNSLTFTATEEFSIGIVLTTGTSGVEGAISDIQLEVGQTATAYEPYVPITETDISFPSPVYGGTLDVVTGELWATWFVHNFLWSDKWYGSELTNVERRAFKLPNGVIPHTMSYYNDHKSEIKCNIAPLLWSYTTDNTHYYVDKDGDYYRALVFLPIGTSEDTQIQVGGTLADPVLITTLTPEQITALLGDNTIWSDADGSMTAVYLKKG